MRTKGMIAYERYIEKYGKLPTELDPDYLELLNMSKYRILAIPDVKPGKCANCGSAKEDGRQYIDFGLDMDWYGVVFICGLCLRDICNAMGLFQSLVDEIGQLKHDLLSINVLQQQGERLQDNILHTFEEVKSYFDSRDVRLARASSLADTTTHVDNESTESNKPVPNGTKQRSAKSTSGARPTNVPSFAELLKDS